MDKDYLLHNLKLNDSNGDHSTLDISLKLKDLEPDVTADVTIKGHSITYVDGNIQEVESNNTYENVSLTGAGGGGGGGGSSYKVVSISTINNSGASKTVTCPRFYPDTTHLSGGNIQIPTGNFQFYTIVPLADGDGYTVTSFSAAPTNYSDGIRQSGPSFHITENASEETITWG